MSDEIEIAGIRVPKADWEATPASIEMLVQIRSERLLALEEKVNQSSQNSSKPPSTDGLANALRKKGKARNHRESRAGQPLPAKPESCIRQKSAVPFMRLFPLPAKAVERVYRAKIAIPTAIK